MKVQEEVFLTWMLEQGYEPSTADATLRLVRSAHQYWDQNETVAEGYLVAPQRRYLTFVQATRQHVYPTTYFTALKNVFDPIVRAPTRGYGPRKKPPFDAGQWATLEALLRKVERSSHPNSPVRYLRLFMLQGYNMHDFLLMTMQEVAEEVDTRAVPWVRDKPKLKKVAELLCPSSPKPSVCAQTRLRRCLQTYATQLGYNVDLRALHKASLTRLNRAA